MNSIEELIWNYKELINPETLLQTEEEFNKFINIPATKEDLECFLIACEEVQKYEWCIKIKDKIEKNGRS